MNHPVYKSIIYICRYTRTDGLRGDNNICTAAVFGHGAFPTADDDTTAAIYMYVPTLLLLCPGV